MLDIYALTTAITRLQTTVDGVVAAVAALGANSVNPTDIANAATAINQAVDKLVPIAGTPAAPAP